MAEEGGKCRNVAGLCLGRPGCGVRGGPLSLKANVWDGIDVLSQSKCVSQYLQL